MNLVAEVKKMPEAVPTELRHTPEQRQEYSELTRQIEDRFRARLWKGEFIVLGFAHPRHPDDFPYHVPKYLLQVGCLSIDGGKARGQGLHFEAIRVALRAAVEAMPSPKASPGRPSRRVTI